MKLKIKTEFRMRYLFIFCFLMSLALSGCSSTEETPVGIGSDMDSLKKSACPCGEVFYRNGVILI